MAYTWFDTSDSTSSLSTLTPPSVHSGASKGPPREESNQMFGGILERVWGNLEGVGGNLESAGGNLEKAGEMSIAYTCERPGRTKLSKAPLAPQPLIARGTWGRGRQTSDAHPTFTPPADILSAHSPLDSPRESAVEVETGEQESTPRSGSGSAGWSYIDVPGVQGPFKDMGMHTGMQSMLQDELPLSNTASTYNPFLPPGTSLACCSYVLSYFLGSRAISAISSQITNPRLQFI